jgi:hypothetical protein
MAVVRGLIKMAIVAVTMAGMVILSDLAASATTIAH